MNTLLHDRLIHVYMSRDLGKPGLMEIDFCISTFSIASILYNKNAKRIVSQTHFNYEVMHIFLNHAEGNILNVTSI